MAGQPLFTHEKNTGLFVGIQDKASHMHFINGYMVGGLRLRFKYQPITKDSASENTWHAKGQFQDM